MVKLIVFGAGGRMGARILDLATRNGSFEVLGAVEARNHPAAGKKIMDGKVAVTSNLSSLKGPERVAIDFTTPEATLAHLELLSEWNGSSAVIGTTGFNQKQKSMIRSFAESMPIVLSPNMSRGVNLMFKLAREAARKLSDYDIEIVEAHHNLKKDSPSGTALALAGEIAEELRRNPASDFVYGRQGAGLRAKKEIGIHAVRAGDIVGEHTVYFAAGGERLEIKHVASSRDAFASGALHAAKWVSDKGPGLYSMKDVLGE